MEEDITCKFRATTTVLKGVFIFLNSIFVCGYWHFFFPHSKEQPVDELRASPPVSTCLNSSTMFSLGEWKASCFNQFIATSFTPAKGWTSIRTKMMSHTLPLGCWSVTFSEMLNTELASVSYNYTYNLIFSICYSLIFFSSNQCHLVIKIFNWIQPKILVFFVSLFTNGLHSH